MDLLTINANGDMRYAINNLEVIYYGYGKIEYDYVIDLCHQPQPEIFLLRNLHHKSLSKHYSKFDVFGYFCLI